jgi:hypothetical protein
MDMIDQLDMGLNKFVQLQLKMYMEMLAPLLVVVE